MKVRTAISVLSFCALMGVLLQLGGCGIGGATTSGKGDTTVSPIGTPQKPPVALSAALCQVVSQDEAIHAANGPVTRVLDAQDQDEELGLDRVTCTYA